MEDLSVASPATVSRSGMVYNDWKDLGWDPFVKSWLAKRKDKVRYVHVLCNILHYIPLEIIGTIAKVI